MKYTRRVLIILFLLFISNCSFAQTQKIKAYFNHPVNTTVSSGVDAVYLNQSIDDTLIAYINRAHYSIDVAVYNYIQSGNTSNIASAINNAYSNGVKVRWIYNGSSSNSGLSQLNSGIHTLASPTSSAYNIMHNKFMIIDGNSTNPDDPIVWTGSCNWDAQQFNFDVNNVIIFQDADFARSYTTEFNEMWGDTGLVPNLSRSKFGPFKTNNTQHIFNIGGTTVEQYFSPSDSTNTHILDAINSANDDLYFGVYTFTDNSDANAISNKIQNQNIYTAGIIDQYSLGFSPYSMLSPVMANALLVYNQSNSIYHSKLMIADPCSPNSDPLVETGSHNWTISANTKNDENTVIVHNETIANMYYQSFYQNFLDLGGTLPPCGNSVSVQEINKFLFTIYPDPANDFLTIHLNNDKNIFAVVYDSFGREVGSWKLNGRENIFPVSSMHEGLYFLKISTGYDDYLTKFIVTH